ncbi:MAG: ATP-grasp domain-containing protein, partial [Abditibacteriales bacterium]|nr:ATP-grasp domain-containing protein [Abditibacteriales bacterium]MDW8368308.1 ATP-grasp domain-containing protein [Abditibacteriales bacterium]
MWRVLVFPSCNEPGLEIITSLAKSNKIALFGGSSYNLDYDPSRLILKNHLLCPDYYDRHFKRDFQKVIDDYQIDIVFPSMDVLVAEFSRWRLPNTTFIVTNTEAATLFLSKSKTYERLKNVVPVPRLYDADHVEFPAYAKPDCGSGSREAMMINTDEELHLARKRGLLISEFLPGDEFTVDCLNDLNGRLLFSNVRVRGHIGRGIALGTRDVFYPEISDNVRRIAQEVRIEGPWFAQFKISRDGQPKLMEVNARVAGSMSLTRLCGVNIPLMSVFLFKGYEVRVPQARTGVLLNRCLRNLGEVNDFKWVIWDWDDTILRKDGKPDPDVIACLYDYNNRGIKQILIS